jgi:L-methionine (R)-S-oxide reductase
MAEELQTIKGSKKEKYESLLPQIAALTTGENDLIANLSNIAAALKQSFNFFWVGFYIVKNNELVLGPFQGTVACTRIAKGKGVCGTAWQEEKTIIVDDVDAFPGHIACSSASRSEIVVPIFGIDPDSHQHKIVGVLDVDSDALNDFDETDRIYLEKLCRMIGRFFE